MPWRNASPTIIRGQGERSWKGWHLKPEELTEDEQDEVVKDLYPVALSAFNQDDTPGFFSDVRNHILQNSDLLIITDEKHEVVAFRMWDTMTTFERPIVYLAGMCVHQDSQGHGIGKSALNYVIGCADRDCSTWGYMVLRTQNPVMQQCFKGVIRQGDLFQFGDESIPEDVQKVAEAVAEKIRDSCLDSAHLVSRNVYGTSLYGSAYEIANKSIGTNFAKLNQDAGDAAYCVWRK